MTGCWQLKDLLLLLLDPFKRSLASIDGQPKPNAVPLVVFKAISQAPLASECLTTWTTPSLWAILSIEHVADGGRRRSSLCAQIRAEEKSGQGDDARVKPFGDDFEETA